MGYETPHIENPTPPRDLQLLVYKVSKEEVSAFLDYYDKTIVPYLIGQGVKDIVVWSIDHGGYVEFLFATSPVIAPWWGTLELAELKEYVRRDDRLVAVNRRELQVHAPEVVDCHHKY